MRVFEFRVVVEDTYTSGVGFIVETTPEHLTRALIDHPAVVGAVPLVSGGAGESLVADMQRVRQSGLTRVDINTALRTGELT